MSLAHGATAVALAVVGIALSTILGATLGLDRVLGTSLHRVDVGVLGLAAGALEWGAWVGALRLAGAGDRYARRAASVLVLALVPYAWILDSPFGFALNVLLLFAALELTARGRLQRRVEASGVDVEAV